MGIYDKLLAIQCELKAPKSQYNSFGKYNYRNCEDILEAAKPLCKKHNALVYLTDTVEVVGERYYIKATANFVDTENPTDVIMVTAYAREEAEKRGMDGSQVTGASSSYARKYALNGLFDIDDTKDSDTTNIGSTGSNEKAQPNSSATSKKSTNVKQSASNALTDETKAKINSCIAQYKSLVGVETKEVQAIVKLKLGYEFSDVKNEEQGKAVIRLLLEMITEVKGGA